MRLVVRSWAASRSPRYTSVDRKRPIDSCHAPAYSWSLRSFQLPIRISFMALREDFSKKRVTLPKSKQDFGNNRITACPSAGAIHRFFARPSAFLYRHELVTDN